MIRRGLPKQDDGTEHDEVRTCHTPGCGRKFRPVEVMCGDSTEFHCSAECAARCLSARDYSTKLVPAIQDDGGDIDNPHESIPPVVDPAG